MVAAASWPSDLPETFEIDGYSENPNENVIREQMAVGPAKTRRRASVTTVSVSASLMLTNAQKSVFDAYYRGVLLHGTRPFAMRDPGGVLREYYVQGVRYSQNLATWPYWRVQLEMEYIA